MSTTSGSISIAAGKGILKLNSSKTIYAGEGNIVLKNTDTAGGSIQLLSNSTVHAFTISDPDLGHVTITIGEAPASPVEGTAPAGVVVTKTGNGQIYYGGGISTSGSNIKLNALDRNIVFNRGSSPLSAILLQSGATVTADPPISPATAGVLPALAAMQAPSVQPAGSRRPQVLAHGESLIWADRDTTVSAGNYAVKIASGSAALVTTNGASVAVRTVYGTTADAVRVLAGASDTIAVPAGCEAILGELHSLRSDKIARRKSRTSTVPGGQALMTSEVSLVSLLQDSTILKQLMRSSDPADRALANKLIKMAACLMQVTSSRGAYTQSR